MEKELGCSIQQHVCKNQEQIEQIADYNKASGNHKGWLNYYKKTFLLIVLMWGGLNQEHMVGLIGRS